MFLLKLTLHLLVKPIGIVDLITTNASLLILFISSRTLSTDEVSKPPILSSKFVGVAIIMKSASL